MPPKRCGFPIPVHCGNTSVMSLDSSMRRCHSAFNFGRGIFFVYILPIVALVGRFGCALSCIKAHNCQW